MSPLVSKALERVREIPNAFWVNLGVAVLLLILLVVILRKLAAVNLKTAVEPRMDPDPKPMGAGD
jgi:hypothetical protein